MYGKGAGILMQKNMTDQDFLDNSRLNKQKVPHVFQEYIKQRQMEHLHPDGQISKFKTVGIISSMDGKFYGPGMFRSNGGDTVSIHGGGLGSFPVLEIHGIPSHTRSMCSELRFADSSAILKSLARDGVALIGVQKRLGDKEEFAKFLREKLGAKCRTHSDLDGEVWDIKPVEKWTAQNARSHTTRPFEIHTDASFEKEPPRFVAMSVIHADRRGGGLFSVSRISDAVSELEKEDVKNLMTIKARWIVPNEFRKTGERDTFAPVLMSHDKARFRQDKVVTDHLPLEEAERFRKSFKAFCGAVTKGISDEYLVPQQTVIILDNQKYAHCRTEVMDFDRHLQRVRFDLANCLEI
ncbi:Taurine catabolism dioxygenase TauD [Gracilaria domingensis]|nr:Taurine catabolism dioxygenase TauD [Gracilaria domingensis]